MVMRETSKIERKKERERGEDHKGQSEGNAATASEPGSRSTLSQEERKRSKNCLCERVGTSKNEATVACKSVLSSLGG